MCGIVGMAGNLGHNHCKMFRDMLLVDAIRGIDSTGVLAVDQVGERINWTTEKDLGGPTNLWDWNNSNIFNDRGVCKTMPKILLGHNRAATMGKIDVESAHPFVEGDVIGVHNGTLRHYSDLSGYTHGCLDSRVLLRNINEEGVADTWKKFHGAAAVVWYNDAEDTLNMVRNSERPLYVAYTEDKKVVMWASESWMIHILAGKHDIKLEKNEKGLVISPKLIPTETVKVFKATNLNVKEEKVIVVEKKKYPTTSQSTTRIGGGHTGTVVGFPRNPKDNVVRRKPRRKSTQINTDWAANTTKLGKETRGVEFSICFKAENGYFVGYTRNRYGAKNLVETIHVYPNNKEDERWLMDNSEYEAIFTTTSRIRRKNDKSRFIYAISSANIALVKEEEEEEEFFIGPYNAQYTEKEWEGLFKSTALGKSCVWCSDTLDIKDHKEHKWISREDCLCPECANDPNTLGYLSSIYNVGVS